ncbi:hotdog fold thioesterase [Pasteurellaceae bacterium HPA106]|uniref:thioesterase, FlK family n=1 Tax=Spirabiliibacterium pneumoniae TaxID=221400 RepID=UPI001AACFB16|nr:hotdog fold thioesterase [Spirabiliibacterium pneumoniae]MBE2896230.1 hotdog fold thioesterase [Spirabiliibacterium pneumoniae]
MMWKRNLSVDALNALCAQSAVSHLGIEFSEKGADYLEARLLVCEKSSQPMGFLHGGASVLLAETVGSLAGLCCVEQGMAVVGSEINASHLRPVKLGDTVRARATALRLGKTQHVWQIAIIDSADRLVCQSRLTLQVVKAQPK